MCKFFSFVTQPSVSRERFYFDWKVRKDDKSGGMNSHSHICAHFKLDEDKCNKWEYNPLTKRLKLDMQNDEIDDTERVKRWLRGLDWKTIVEPLVVKPIVHPFKLPKVNRPTKEQIDLLKAWDSVLASVGASVWDSVWASVCDSVWASVWASVWDSVWASVRDLGWDSVLASVGASVLASASAYTSSFFDVDYKHDLSSAIKLWESGLVPSFDGQTWRLHSGEKAEIVCEWTPEIGQKERNDA